MLVHGRRPHGPGLTAPHAALCHVPQGPPSLVPLSLPLPFGWAPGAAGAVGLCGAVGGRVRAWVGRVRGGFGPFGVLCLAFSSRHHTAPTARERQGGQARTAKAHTQDSPRPTEATAKPGRRRAARKGGPKAHTAEQGQDPGGTRARPVEAGQGPEAQARKGPKAHVPARPGAQHASCRAPARRAPPAGPRSRTATTTPGTHRKRREGQRDEGGMALGEGGKRRAGMELPEHGRRVCRVELAPGAGWALEVWLMRGSEVRWPRSGDRHASSLALRWFSQAVWLYGPRIPLRRWPRHLGGQPACRSRPLCLTLGARRLRGADLGSPPRQPLVTLRMPVAASW